MNNLKKIRPVILLFDPTGETKARSNITERRDKKRDRRRVHTYIANDRRSGIADRRKKHLNDKLPS